MSTITNIAKPTTVITNAPSVRSGETWASITTTWAGETRTWAQCISIFMRFVKPTTTITNVARPT